MSASGTMTTGGDRVVLDRSQRSDLAVRWQAKTGGLRGFGPLRSVDQLDYFHGSLDAAAAERRLVEPAAFLLRRDPPDGALVLSVRAADDRVRHVLLPRAEGGYRLPCRPFVESAEEFVNYYRTYDVPLLRGVRLDAAVEHGRSGRPLRDEPPQLAKAMTGFGEERPTEALSYHHGRLSASAAERRLSTVGAFLLRRDTIDDALVLSVRAADDRVRHVLLPRAEGGYRLPCRPFVESAEEFVNYYRTYDVPLLRGVRLDAAVEHGRSGRPLRDEPPQLAKAMTGFGEERPTEALSYHHGRLSASAAERRLSTVGAFLLRRDTIDDALVLSVRAADRCYHVLPRRAPDGLFALPGGPHARTPEEYVNYFHTYDVPLFKDVFLNSSVAADASPLD